MSDDSRTVDLMLVRHGETRLNAEGRFQSETDAPLSESGARQAELLARRIRRDPGGRRWGAVHSSTSLRARQTADRIAAELAVPRLSLHELAERRLGELDGKVREQWQRRHPLLAGRLVEDVDFAPPRGESMRHALLRFVIGMRRSISSTPAGVTGIVIVAHGGVLGALLRREGLVDRGTPPATLLGHCVPVHVVCRLQGSSCRLSTAAEATGRPIAR